MVVRFVHIWYIAVSDCIKQTAFVKELTYVSVELTVCTDCSLVH